MAESVVDAALAVVKSTVAAGVALQLGVKASHLEDIKSDLELFKTYLTTTDEERSQDKMKMERVWARQVRDVTYDVEDYMEDCRIHLANWSWWSPSNILKWCRIAGEMEELRSKVRSAWKRRKLCSSMAALTVKLNLRSVRVQRAPWRQCRRLAPSSDVESMI